MEELTMVIRMDSGVARYGVPGLILGFAMAWWTGTRGPEVQAQTDGGSRTTKASPPASSATTKSQGPRTLAGGDSSGTLALITSSLNGPQQWLYLIDTKDRSFALYRVDPTNTKGIVKLEASRQYRWDLKLEHYNNQAPEPDAIKATVETLARSTQGQ
jgi:hypothetical protein